MSIHSEQRALERYNLELTEADAVNILNQINQKEAIFVQKGYKGQSGVFYVKIKNIPLKVLVSNPQRVIITALPFNTDEYNKLKEKHLNKRVAEAIRLLEYSKYTVIEPVKTNINKEVIIKENSMKDCTKNTHIKCPICGGKAYEVMTPFGQYCCVNCQTFTSHRGLVQAEVIKCPKCEVQYEAIPQHMDVNCQDCGCVYNQYSRTTKTDKWVGDFIERCKGG